VPRSPLVARVDHLVVAVRDLDEAERVYGALLGLEPSWRGTHPTYGTRNVLYGLRNAYLELLALGPGAPAHPLAAALQAYLSHKAEGLFALALGTDDVDRAAAALEAAGLEPGRPTAGEGRAASGATRCWRSLVLPRTRTRGVNLIVIAHAPGQALPLARPTRGGGSCVSALDHVVLFSDDLEGALRLWRGDLDVAERWRRDIPERGTVNVGLRLGGVTIELVAPLGSGAGDRGERLWGAAYQVDDCDAAVERLRTCAIPVSDVRPGLAPRTRVATVKWTDRVPTLLIAHTTPAETAPPRA
jgi:catechol 2,3-dioxygenase-like lactoylglutathione lyase family enzyme